MSKWDRRMLGLVNLIARLTGAEPKAERPS